MIDLRLALRSLPEWPKRIADAAERQFPGVEPSRDFAPRRGAGSPAVSVTSSMISVSLK